MNTCQLERIYFENVTYKANTFSQVLEAVDFDFPMDQTVVIQSSKPAHSVYLLEVLAGRKAPQAGRIFWNDTNILENLLDQDETPSDSSNYQSDGSHEDSYVGCYFENQRAHPQQTVAEVLKYMTGQVSGAMQVAYEASEHFEWGDILQTSFKNLTYEQQKLLMLVSATLKDPQMLILEDPATGLSEQNWLEYLDWVQKSQRAGHMRHIYLTNHHPAALRHLEYSLLHLEDGLLYLEDNQKQKKAIHF